MDVVRDGVLAEGLQVALDLRPDERVLYHLHVGQHCLGVEPVAWQTAQEGEKNEGGGGCNIERK